MKRTKILSLIALVMVFAMALTACGGDEATETTAAVQTENAAPQALGLTDWSMSAATWSSPNGATVSVTATPTSHADGQTAAFVIRLEGEDVENIPCEWNGTSYTAEAELNAADGYCYYVVLTAADGTTTEVAVNTPTEPTDEALIDMESALKSYCNVLVESHSFDGSKLTLTGGSVQVQAPKITDEGQAITCAEAVLILSCNGEDVATEKLTLEATAITGSYELALTNVAFDVPAMEDDQQLTLRLDVTLSNGQSLTAPGGTWFYNDGELLVAVG